MHDVRLGRLAGMLADIDGIHIWHDQALIKEPFSNATSFHFDVPYWSFDSRDAISIWVALDDATLKNGCLYFLPGSHKLAGFSGRTSARIWVDVHPVSRFRAHRAGGRRSLK